MMIVMTSVDGSKFYFKPNDKVSVFINDTSTCPTDASYLDDDRIPFYITCREQHEGDCYRIISVKEVP